MDNRIIEDNIGESIDELSFLTILSFSRVLRRELIRETCKSMIDDQISSACESNELGKKNKCFIQETFLPVKTKDIR